MKSWAPLADARDPSDRTVIKPSGSELSERGNPRTNGFAGGQGDPATATLPGESGAAGAVAPARFADQRPRPERTDGATDAQRAGQTFCANIADRAADARFLAQKKQLEDLQRQLDERIVLLDAKTAEYRKWLARRDEFAKKAQGQIIEIYARMKPDAAAPQLAAMDEETAAAMLTKLNMRSASAILNEMPPEKAARLTSIIAGAASGPSGAAATPKPPGGS